MARDNHFVQGIDHGTSVIKQVPNVSPNCVTKTYGIIIGGVGTRQVKCKNKYMYCTNRAQYGYN